MEIIFAIISDWLFGSTKIIRYESDIPELSTQVIVSIEEYQFSVLGTYTLNTSITLINLLTMYTSIIYRHNTDSSFPLLFHSQPANPKTLALEYREYHVPRNCLNFPKLCLSNSHPKKPMRKSIGSSLSTYRLANFSRVNRRT